MAESIVSDWLSDYTLLEPSEIRTFAAQHEHNHEVASALFTVLNERLKYPDLLHSICNQFFNFYRSNEINLRKFTLQFIPTLVYIYLNSVAQGDKRSCRSIETLLISIYNIEICSDDGQPKTIAFRMPVLAQPSVYHEEKNLNASDLRRWEENSNKEVHWGPLHQVESINAQNRVDVMTALMFTYNQQLSLMQKSALSHLCRAASLLVNQGFSKLGHAHRTSYGTDPTNAIVPKPLPRIAVSPKLLLELLHAVYFAMFNEFASIAIQTVDDIYNRSCYELYPEVILVTNAIKNSLHANPSGQPSDGPMGLSVALTPSTTTVTVSKSMITNASFRTKKLPDDLELEFVAALEAQQNNQQQHYHHPQHNYLQDPNRTFTTSFTGENGQLIETLPSDVPRGRSDQKKRWKNWSWKHSPGGKPSSIEEEPDSPRHSMSSKTNSPKHSSSKNKDDRKTPSPFASPMHNRVEARATPGARLCQLFDETMNDSDDELQALLINGRPASIHVVSSTRHNLIENES